MPSPLDGEEKVVRRRRAPARASVGGDETSVRKPRKTAVKRAPRKITPNRIDEEKVYEVERVVDESSNRKAPTSIRREDISRRRRKKQMIVVGGIMFIGIATSAAVGFTDKGQINVNQTIEARNERIRNNTANEKDIESSTVEVPVQNTNANTNPNAGKADGGLIGITPSKGSVPKPVGELVKDTTTASTTEVKATSTEPVETEEEVDATENSESEEVPSTE